ncbi:MAG: alpha/beta hydrolase [Tabrizicola sp.]|nr:alpha/beta hydrolase [Tabrizicola sp.]
MRIAVRILLLLVLAAVLVGALYSRDMGRIRAAVATESTLIDTRHGPIEVAIWGKGPTVLAIHGAGGGYDQARILAQEMGGEGFRWIAVSRFGYLRSPLPADGSTRAQAEAFADLLDAVGEDRVSLLAMSGGVPPALQFAALYPERTARLVLLSSAPFTPLTAASQDLPLPAWAYQALFRTDFPLWAISRLSPRSLYPMFDIRLADAEMTADDRAFVDALIAAFLPVTGRAAGLANEGAAIDPDERYDLGRITAPALVIHARDDGINPFPIGEYLAAHLPGAHFRPVEGGGHLLLGHIGDLRRELRAFLAAADP